MPADAPGVITHPAGPRRDDGLVHEASSTPPARVPRLRRHADTVVAEVDDLKVGEARLLRTGASWGARVYVHPAWRRQGLGLGLLRAVADLAADAGAEGLDVRLDAQDLAGLRLVLASGMCGAISCDGGETRTHLVLVGSRTAQALGV